MIRSDKKGFTLVELMLAMTFFSFVLLFAISGFIQINRTFTRGVTQKGVQRAARLVIDEVGDAIRSAAPGSVEVHNSAAGVQRVCIGDVRFGFNQHRGDPTRATFTSERFNNNSTRIILAKTSDSSSNCTDPIERLEDRTRTLINTNYSVHHLYVERVGTSNSYKIELVISTEVDYSRAYDFSQYGEDARCEVATGDEYCYVAKLETVVTARN